MLFQIRCQPQRLRGRAAAKGCSVYRRAVENLRSDRFGKPFQLDMKRFYVVREVCQHIGRPEMRISVINLDVRPVILLSELSYMRTRIYQSPFSHLLILELHQAIELLQYFRQWIVIQQLSTSVGLEETLLASSLFRGLAVIMPRQGR